MYSDKENVHILTALLVQHGVRHIVVCPGSRNSALSHNFNEQPDIICLPATDERSAGFLALGIALQTRNQPVAVCVTSGSALLNVLPAVAEADYQRCGIVIISADRPSQWIDQLDGQTLPQTGVLNTFVAKAVNLPEPHDDEERWYCNRLINEAFIALKRTNRPVHINIPISEPFFSFTTKELTEQRKVEYFDWNDASAKDRVIEHIGNAKRPMMVFGQLHKDIITDELAKIEQKLICFHEPLSADGLPNSMTDQMLSVLEEDCVEYIPDLIIYSGRHTVSKRLRHFLRKLPLDTSIIMVDNDGELHDVSMNATMLVHGNTATVLSDIIGYYSNHKILTDSQYLNSWQQLMQRVSARHSQYTPAYSSMKAVKLFEELYGNEIIHYANSMSVRLGAIYTKSQHRYCNRGVNGIEGSLSTAAGMSLALHCESNPKKVFCVIGDLSFFYDENALWQQQLTGNLRILLLNNYEGGIFRNLKGLEQSPSRNTLVAGSHRVSAEGICQQFGLTYRRVTTDQELQEGMEWLGNVESQRPVVLEVITDAQEDETIFKNYYRNLKYK